MHLERNVLCHLEGKVGLVLLKIYVHEILFYEVLISKQDLWSSWFVLFFADLIDFLVCLSVEMPFFVVRFLSPDEELKKALHCKGFILFSVSLLHQNRNFKNDSFFY